MPLHKLANQTLKDVCTHFQGWLFVPRGLEGEGPGVSWTGSRLFSLRQWFREMGAVWEVLSCSRLSFSRWPMGCPMISPCSHTGGWTPLYPRAAVLAAASAGLPCLQVSARQAFPMVLGSADVVPSECSPGLFPTAPCPAHHLAWLSSNITYTFWDNLCPDCLPSLPAPSTSHPLHHPNWAPWEQRLDLFCSVHACSSSTRTTAGVQPVNLTA
jgi:hypothetical protein